MPLESLTSLRGFNRELRNTSRKSSEFSVRKYPDAKDFSLVVAIYLRLRSNHSRKVPRSPIVQEKTEKSKRHFGTFMNMLSMCGRIQLSTTFKCGIWREHFVDCPVSRSIVMHLAIGRAPYKTLPPFTKILGPTFVEDRSRFCKAASKEFILSVSQLILKRI